MTNKSQNSINNKRMYIAVAVMLVALAAVGSLIGALAQFNSIDSIADELSTDESSAEVSEVSEDSSDESVEPAVDYKYYDTLVLENRPYNNSTVATGSLAVVNMNSSTMPVVDSEKLARISTTMTKNVYGLSGNALKLERDAIVNIDKMICSFYEEVPKNGLIINQAYMDPSSVSDENVDLTTAYSVRFSIYKSNYSFKDEEFSYLRDQAYRYGVIQRYPDGKSAYTGREADNTIYRYVGVAHSWYMNFYKLSLEEYLDKIRTEKVLEFDSQIEANTAYVVYYVPVDASVGTTYVPVPTNSNFPHTVSGDGSGGFVVTVKIKKQ